MPTLFRSSGLARPVGRAPFAIVAAGLMAVALNGQAQNDTQRQASPNIVLIVADDVGWGDLGAYGGGEGRGARARRSGD